LQSASSPGPVSMVAARASNPAQRQRYGGPARQRSLVGPGVRRAEGAGDFHGRAHAEDARILLGTAGNTGPSLQCQGLTWPSPHTTVLPHPRRVRGLSSDRLHVERSGGTAQRSFTFLPPRTRNLMISAPSRPANSSRRLLIYPCPINNNTSPDAEASICAVVLPRLFR
jgi:hypothetical protein